MRVAKRGKESVLSSSGARRVSSDFPSGLLAFRIRAMPFKSQAQRRKFAELLVKGEISNKTFEEWNRETGGRKLPEHVKKKPKKSRKRR